MFKQMFKKRNETSSDEEKKALIIGMQRAMMEELCGRAGTQSPVFFIHPNADGSGSLTAIWESEAAAVESLFLAVDDGSGDSMTYDQKKAFVLKAVVDSHNVAGVKYTITEEGTNPRLAKGVVSYPNYKKMLDTLYKQSKQMQQQMQQAQQQQGQMFGQQQMFGQMSGGMDPIRAQVEAQNLGIMQQHGLAPTHYKNGIPNYSGPPTY